MKRHLLLYVGTGIGIVALAVVLVAATRGRSRSEAPAAGRSPAIDVELATAALADLGHPFEVGGDVRARETAIVTSRIVAEVKAVRVKPGDRVRAGQGLVLLDARDLAASHLQAQAALIAAQQAAQLAAAQKQAADAALSLASVTFRRVSDLRQKNSATPAELDDAQAGLRAAEARVKSAEAQVAQAAAGIDVAQSAARAAAVGESFATLTAPFEGVVTQKLIDPGNMASPGVPLLTVEDTRSFRLEIRIDESRASLVSLGQRVDVAFDAMATPGAVGHVSELARIVDPNAHAFLAKIDLPPLPGLRAGMFGRARFAGPTARVLAVPESSIVRRGQITAVFVVDRTNTARLRLVTLAEPVNGQVEVRAGLDAGEAVVVAPPPDLTDGAPVRPRVGKGSAA